MTDVIAHRTLVALTPQDMPAAQAEIMAWCKERIIAVSQELAEARRNVTLTKKMLLGSPKAWMGVAKKAASRMIYYAKIQAAVRAGYLVVPNFPMELLAVRVKRSRPPDANLPGLPREAATAVPELNLPAGQGRYVDELNCHEDASYSVHRTNAAGQKFEDHIRLTHITGYDETVDFPVTLVKPEILAATQRAMALKIFDQIGVVHGQGTLSKAQRRADPIVVGRIIDGSKGKYGYGGGYKHYVTFFIAWWLDTRSL